MSIVTMICNRGTFLYLFCAHQLATCDSMSLPVVIVTGSSRGIGQAIVHELLLSGRVQVLGVARSSSSPASSPPALAAHPQKSDHTTQALYSYVSGDITDEATLDLLEKKLTLLGDPKLLGIVHNAGYSSSLRSELLIVTSATTHTTHTSTHRDNRFK